MRLSEHHHRITDLFAKYGIRPDVETTGSGHVQFRWTIAGRPETFTVAKTPSDWRAVSNNLSAVKRMLRAAGLSPIVAPACKTNKPDARTVALEARVAQLERDMLLILAQLTSPLALSPIAPEPVATADPPVVKAPPTRIGRPLQNCDWLWRVLRYDDFLALGAIVEATRRPENMLSQTLYRWKKRGYVEHRPHIGYRKHRSVEELTSTNGHHLNGKNNNSESDRPERTDRNLVRVLT